MLACALDHHLTLSAVTQNEDDDHLDEYERWARDRLSQILGPLRRVDQPGGKPGMHDFEADLADHLAAVIEVTSEVDSDRLNQAVSVERHRRGSGIPRFGYG
jgi:hypothetical protein